MQHRTFQYIVSFTHIEFSTSSDLGFYFIPIGEIHNFETTFPFDKNGNGRPVKFNLKIQIIHCPNPLNLSHFEIRCEANFPNHTNNTMSRVGRGKYKGYRMEICHAISEKVKQVWTDQLA